MKIIRLIEKSFHILIKPLTYPKTFDTSFRGYFIYNCRYIRRFALVDDSILPANTNQAVAIIRVNKDKILPEYLYSSFLGNWHNDYYKRHVQQAVQANLSLTTIKSLLIPMLPQAELQKYMELVHPIIKYMKKNEKENYLLAEQKNFILPKFNDRRTYTLSH